MNDTNRTDSSSTSQKSDLPTETPENAAPEEIQAILADLKANAPWDRGERDAKIVMLKAQGATIRDIAAEAGVCTKTVSAICKRNFMPLDKIKETLQRVALAHGYAQFSDMTAALLTTAQNTESRNQAACARVYGELTGIIGKTNIHIGDSYAANVTVDLGSRHVHVGHDPELEARLRKELVGD